MNAEPSGRASRIRWRYSTASFTIATGGTAGVYYAYGLAYARELNRDLPGLQVQVISTAGSVDNLTRLARGDVQLAFVAGDTASQVAAIAEQVPAPGGIAAIARIYDEYAQIVVRRDSTIRRLKDLTGMRVSTGSVGSSVEVTASRLLRAAGMDPDRDLLRRRLGVADSVELMRTGRLDAFFWVGGLPTQGIVDLAANTPLRLVPVGEYVNQLRAEWGTFYRRATVPAAVPEATDTVAVPSYLVVSKSLDADLVYRLTQTLFSRRSDIAATVPSGRLLDLRTAIATSTIPLHPGALRYYRARKP